MRPVDWKLSLAGLLIGLLVGITGMGGGSLMTPMLVFLFGFKPTVAIGTDILHGAVFKSFGAIRHRQLGTVHARLTRLDAARLGAVLARSASGSRSGSSVATATGSRTPRAMLLGIALIVCGIGFALKTFLTGRVKSDAPFIMSAADRRVALIAGASGGFVVGITSVGSGTFFGLVMLLVFPLTASKVVGTDIFHAAALLWVAGAGHLVAGNVNLHAMGWLLVGSIPGVLLGSNVSVKLPDRVLRLGLATTLTLSGIKLADVPGAELVIIVVLSAIGAALLAIGAWKVAVRLRLPRPIEPEATRADS